jgi:hypothetical protein
LEEKRNVSSLPLKAQEGEKMKVYTVESAHWQLEDNMKIIKKEDHDREIKRLQTEIKLLRESLALAASTLELIAALYGSRIGPLKGNQVIAEETLAKITEGTRK